MPDVDNNTTKWQLFLKIAVLIATVCVTVGILVIITNVVTSKGKSSKKNLNPEESEELTEFCTTEECLKQASRILKNMDRSVNPCTNFYNFTCGNFMKYSKIPRDQTRLLVVIENAKIVEDELVNAYNADPKLFIRPLKEVQTFYHQCINSGRDEDNSIESVRRILYLLKWPILFRNWTKQYSKSFNWVDMEANLSNMGLMSVFLNTELKFDMKNFSAAYIALDCTVPKLSREMLNDTKVINEYKSVTKQFLQMIGRNYIERDIDAILDFFIEVEKIKPTRFELSDANFFNSFETVHIDVLEKKLNINLVDFLNRILPSSITVTADTVLGTNSYNCLMNMTSMLRTANERAIANYMVWVAVQNLFWIISKKTWKLDFLLNRIQTGVQAPLPLSKLCVNFIDDQLPELASAMYIKINYSPAKKKKLATMVKLLIKELMKAIRAATWMDQDTKKMAKEKVYKLSYVISYEDSTIDDDYLHSTYKNLKITKDVIENVRNIRKITYYHMMETLKWPPMKRNQATLLPLAHVINAYYHPGLNAIAIPAGIAHGYVYSEEQEAYSNFGSIGIIIGHELSHVFDNVGRLYDARGKYVNWWTQYSNLKFIEKSQCFIKQYDNFTIGGKLKINGTLTLGENIADAGGMLLAYGGFLKWKKKYKVKKLPGLENYTLEQLFWISVGNTWCDKLRPERLDMFLKTDVHSLGNFRVLGPLANSKEFSRDFECPLDSYMNRKDKCTIW